MCEYNSCQRAPETWHEEWRQPNGGHFSRKAVFICRRHVCMDHARVLEHMLRDLTWCPTGTPL